MKKIIYMIVTAAAMLFAVTEADAQMGKRYFINGGWQFNGTPGNEFVKSAQGYGAYAEGGYYVTPMFAVGGFANFNTNDEYIPMQTYTFSDQSALTTDLTRTIYQMPFGAMLRYRFMRTEFQPYLQAKLGAEYSNQNTYMSTFVNRHENWGFYVSPEVGMTFFPFQKADFGFQIAAFYAFATNQNKSYDIKGIHNVGFKLGIAF